MKMKNKFFQKKRILVVDDNDQIRVLLLDALTMCGYEVAAGADGAEGWNLFQQTSFDLVITDCKMPKTDGYQLANLIKKSCPHTPIIMITGQERDEVWDKLQQAHIDYLMFKPFKLNDLYQKVRVILYNKRSGENASDTIACRRA